MPAHFSLGTVSEMPFYSELLMSVSLNLEMPQIFLYILFHELGRKISFLLGFT